MANFNAAAAGGALTLLEAWVALLAFALQIYFDFSGYSDMAIGLARMFGFRLLEKYAVRMGGASTLTQQLARNTFTEELPSRDRSIKRKVFESLTEPWFETPWRTDKRGYIGEDVFFCRKAAAAGSPSCQAPANCCRATARQTGAGFA